jgi:sulfatase maturation enzyme AslB (radical SAM superfamily)
MREPLTVVETRAPQPPLVPFVRLTTLWIQITGTWCNLVCTHCINASGPRDPWLKPLDATTARLAISDADALGVKEIYFTGGEPFLHPEMLSLLEEALAVAPTTVLTNGTAITEAIADDLGVLARHSPYSFDVRVSLDDVDRAANDRIRGEGAWARAIAAIRRLHARGILPIVTATEILSGAGREPVASYQRFRDFLVGLGIDKPRVKIMPVFALGRLAADGGARLTEEALDGFDREVLQCADARVVADGGVYACPILAGLPGARLSTGSIEESFRPARLYHSACVTCHQTGMTCRNS